MKKQYGVAVLVGRFQPFHNGHAALLSKAFELAPHVVIVLGSSFQARDAKNPFTWEERAAMISLLLPVDLSECLSFVPIRDCYDDRLWVERVHEEVHAHLHGRQEKSRSIAVVGHFQDASSYYLNRLANSEELAPDWEFVEVQPSADQKEAVDASALRQIYFETESMDVTMALLTECVPPVVAQYMQGWARLPHFARLREEHLSIEQSRKVWGSGPFITVDAVVQAAGYVLLVRRGRSPGKNLWALPGGFLDGRERVLQGAIRELREETELALLDSSLEACLVDVAVFDHPDRSQRGRTITHAHYFDLKEIRLPQVKGADDAADARWVSVADLCTMEEQFFEDHFHILRHFLPQLDH